MKQMKNKKVILLILFIIIIILIFSFYFLNYNLIYKNSNYLRAEASGSSTKCPVAPIIEGVANGSSFYDDKIKYTVVVSNLTTTQINNLKIQISTYKESKSKYFINGKEKEENIGSFSGKEEVKVSDLESNEEKSMKKPLKD